MKRCPVCEHPEHSSVNAWLNGGISARSISKRINLSRVRLKRHAERCMGEEDSHEVEDEGTETVAVANNNGEER